MTDRVRILGLDGMSVEMFLDVVHAGALPRGAELLEASTLVDLRSTVPSFTVPGWTSVFTGVRPGEHGLLWWRRSGPDLPWRAADGSGFVSLEEAGRPPLWRLLAGTGKRVAVIDVPATYPAPAVDGLFVSGFLAPWPDRDAVYPPDLFDRVRDWPPQSGGLPDGSAGGEADPAELVRGLTLATEHRLELFRSSCREHDLVALVLVGPDRLSHVAWPDLVPRAGSPLGAQVRRFWFAVDAFLGELVEARRRGDAVIVCSDHGSAGPPSVRFRTRSWLVAEGFVEASGLGRALPSRAWRALRPARDLIRPAIRRLRPARPGRSFGIAGADSRVVDLALGDREVGFFLSPRGRAEVPDLSLLLIEALSEVRHEGEPLFEAVDRAEAFLGPIAPGVAAPDVIAVTRPDAGVTPGSVFDAPFARETERRRGIHRREGLLLLAADGPAALPPDPVVEDVAPTALGLLGFRAPAWMSGRVLVPTAEVRPLPSPAPATPREVRVSEEQERAIEDHLRDLGYLD